MSIEEMKEFILNLGEVGIECHLKEQNKKYRNGISELSDNDYDALMILSRELYPDNSWFNLSEVEPESIEGKTIALPKKMLSTEKAYSLIEIQKWSSGVVKVGHNLGIKNVLFKITPKLDGFAAYDDGEVLYTRGDGRKGTDITRAIDNGLFISNRGLGAGEIVVNKEYFNSHLSSLFDNSRNIISGVIKEGVLDDIIIEAINKNAVSFQPFSELRKWVLTAKELEDNLEMIWNLNLESCLFDTDGLVIEAIDPEIKDEMGSTGHHWKWQIAYKKNTEYHDIRVLGVIWQTSKNGKLTPVVQLEPTKVSGVTISRASGHNYGNVFNQGIDKDAIVRVCRSGLVIPYIESVIKKTHTIIPSICPSCNSTTEIDGDNLLCSNVIDCPAQIEGIIEFFFKTLGNNDGFGPKIIEHLCNSGIRSVVEIYAMTKQDFNNIIGGKTGDNLFAELQKSKLREIEDWRFLAAFSIHNIGKGGCEKLLQTYKLCDIFQLKEADIVKIDGFAKKTSNILIESLVRIKPSFDILMGMGFTLIETNIGEMVNNIESDISGKVLVFTGKMISNRTTMEEEAKKLGAVIGSAVNSKTDILIIGEKVGSVKITRAEKYGVSVITEYEYLALIK